MLDLQRTAGNRAVGRLLSRACCDSCAHGDTCESETEEEGDRLQSHRDQLESPRFVRADGQPEPTLEACFEDRARLTLGDGGEPVAMVQQALIDLGFELGPTGADGDFGSLTWEAVKQFKAGEALGWEWMGDVGPGTMRRLDELFPPSLPVCPVDPDVVTAANADVVPAASADVVTAPSADATAAGNANAMTAASGAAIFERPFPRPTPRPSARDRCNPRRHRDPPLPAGACPPAPPARGVCGPDITAEVAASWRKARSDFFALPFGQKLANCRMLIQPVIPDPSGHGFTLNADAFDTWGLFQGSAVWTRVPPWHGPCGTPGTTSSDVCDAFDPLHECDTVCSDAVQVGSECWLMGTVNYGLFGVAMRACHDWASPLELLLPFSASMFSLPATMSLVGAYKLLKGDNIVGPEKWASKTWALGPSAVASGGNRPNCGTTCPGPAPPPFLIVWEPNMPRSGMPVGSPYTC